MRRRLHRISSSSIRNPAPVATPVGMVILPALMAAGGNVSANTDTRELLVVVTDTSAIELRCSCSPDLAKHCDVLRAYMNTRLGRPVRFEYTTDFAFDAPSDGASALLRRADMIIGKSSAVEFVTTALEIPSRAEAYLTRMSGNPMSSGVRTARVADGLTSLADLAAKCLSIGRPRHAEKHSDALL